MRWLLALLFLSLTAHHGFCADSNQSNQLQLLAPQQKSSIQQTTPHTDISTLQIRDIAGPVFLPKSPIQQILPWLGGLIFIILIGLLFLYLRRRKSVSIKTPAEIALEEMARAKGFLDAEQLAVYAEQITEILRKYITGRFNVKATSKTTREFLHLISTEEAEDSMLQCHQGMLRECLTQVDLVKFAGFSPDFETISGLEQAVSRFIQQTSSEEEDK